MIMSEKMVGKSRMTTQLVVYYMYKLMAYTAIYITRDRNHIESQKSLQIVHYESNGGNKRAYKYKMVDKVGW